jgi:hypothetical protein
VTSLVGCVGSIGGDSPGEQVASETSAFSCHPEALPPELPLRRLSQSQYRNAVRDLVAVLAPNDGAAVLAEIEPRLDEMPPDVRSGPEPIYGGMRRVDQALYADSVNASYFVAVAVGTAISSSSTRLEAAAGSCASDGDPSNDDACVDAFIQSFGERVLRRALSDEDVAFYRAVVGAPPTEPEDYMDIVTMLMTSPWFLYFVEQGGDGASPGTVRLSAYERAARLSFHFWQTIPDEQLLAKARDGSLLDDAVYAAEVQRLYDDPRTQSALDEFFVDWLDPDHLGNLDANVGTPDFDAFRGEFTPTAELRDHMMQELARMGRYYALDAPDSFQAFFRSNRSFAETEDVAALYGVAPWTGGQPPVFPEAARQGLLTRAALTATGTARTRPIMKGVFARKAILCDELPPPPADAMQVAMELEEDALTSRERAQAISELRSDCAGCHKLLINPLGFVTESFDSLGRYRTVETVHDRETGEVVAEVPVDTAGIPRVTSNDERSATSAIELDQYMLESEKPEACFTRRYFRFTFGRQEDDERDGCALVSLHAALLRGDSLRDVLKGVALSPGFLNKTIEP